MAAHLTDKQKRKIIRDYVETGNYTAVAEAHGVSRNTVKNTVLADPKFVQKCREKKSANSRAILAHMDTKRSMVCQIMDRYLAELLDVDQFEKLTPMQLSGALGMLIDKFALEVSAASSAQQDDDPLTAALKESANAVRKAN